MCLELRDESLEVRVQSTEHKVQLPCGLGKTAKVKETPQWNVSMLAIRTES